MDIGKSFTYMFEDPNWVAKLAIGGAILLVGTLFSFLIGIPLLVASAIVLGYILTVTRNVAEGAATPLPEWNDFGAFFMKGLYAIIGSIIIYIPAIVLVCCVAGVSAALSNASNNSSSGNAGGALGLVIICFQCLLALYSIIAAIYLYAPLTRFALNGQLSVFWDFSGNLKFIQANTGNYIIALLLGPVVANFIAGFGVIACVIGVFFTTFWAYLVGAHLFGQVARGASAQTTMTPPPMMPMTPPPVEPMSPA
jgi:hypothetical protein